MTATELISTTPPVEISLTYSDLPWQVHLIIVAIPRMTPMEHDMSHESLTRDRQELAHRHQARSELQALDIVDTTSVAGITVYNLHSASHPAKLSVLDLQSKVIVHGDAANIVISNPYPHLCALRYLTDYPYDFLEPRIILQPPQPLDRLVALAQLCDVLEHTNDQTQIDAIQTARLELLQDRPIPLVQADISDILSTLQNPFAQSISPPLIWAQEAASRILELKAIQ
jgi:hypothetical protein